MATEEAVAAVSEPQAEQQPAEQQQAQAQAQAQGSEESAVHDFLCDRLPPPRPPGFRNASPHTHALAQERKRHWLGVAALLAPLSRVARATRLLPSFPCPAHTVG